MNRIYRNKRSGAQAGRRTFCTPMARFMSSKARIDIRSFGIKGSVWKTTVSSPSVKSSESFQKPEEKEEEETIETQQIRIWEWWSIVVVVIIQTNKHEKLAWVRVPTLILHLLMFTCNGTTRYNRNSIHMHNNRVYPPALDCGCAYDSRWQIAPAGQRAHNSPGEP